MHLIYLCLGFLKYIWFKKINFGYGWMFRNFVENNFFPLEFTFFKLFRLQNCERKETNVFVQVNMLKPYYITLTQSSKTLHPLNCTATDPLPSWSCNNIIMLLRMPMKQYDSTRHGQRWAALITFTLLYVLNQAAFSIWMQIIRSQYVY